MDAAEYRTPGQLIAELLDSRGWSQKVLATVIGVDGTSINKLVTGKRPIDATMALTLSQIFGVEAEKFLELQKTYDLAQARIVARPDPNLANRAHLFSHLPISDMIKRGWLDVDDIKDMTKVESSLAKFFGTSNSEEIEIMPHAAKKTNVFGGCLPVQLAWLYRVKQIASEMLVAEYSQRAVEALAGKLKPLLISVDAARKVPRMMAESGIRYLLVEALPSSKIDGVCLWLDDKSPVIAMSMRYDRIDNFWFVLRHELEHVIRCHGRESIMLDTDLEGERAGTGATIPDEERDANSAAADFCVPQKSLDQFIARKAPIFAERDVLGFARTLQIHPGLVAGQIQHKTKQFNRFRDHLIKIRSIVAPSATVDGWGDVVPIGE